MYMKRTIVQVPMSSELKINAEKAARADGFSSLQEAIRVFLQKFSTKQITLSMQTIDDEPPLSAKAKRRYGKMVKEIKQGKGLVHVENTDELFRLLRI
jgi:hypothetical protein